MTFSITWETNSKPQPTDGYTISHHPSQLQSVLEEIRPYIQRLIGLSFPNIMGSPHDSSDNLLVGLLLVSDYMRQQGVDPDPSGILQILVQICQQQQAAPTNFEPAELGTAPDPAGM
jgi:hypothetical protein